MILSNDINSVKLASLYQHKFNNKLKLCKAAEMGSVLP